MPFELQVAVVGGGPAGLAAGLHLARAGIAHRVFERRRPGGLLHAAGLVECYPGFPGGIQGPRLAAAMVRQARVLGVLIEQAEVTGARQHEGRFCLDAGAAWTASCLILATGTVPRGVAPEGFAGPVHHGTDSLPRRLAGERVWISGGGDAAFDSALQARDRGASVEVFLRGEPRAMELLVRRAAEAGVQVHRGSSVAQALTEGAPDHLLICHGRDPEDLLWRQLMGVEARPTWEVETHVRGLFLAGDIVRGNVRYAAVAAGDGLRAARLAEALLGR
ncbi:MAG: NAD(P)/FAD-dependent oxidoreductase [Pseudomonadota bacterium]